MRQYIYISLFLSLFIYLFIAVGEAGVHLLLPPGGGGAGGRHQEQAPFYVEQYRAVWRIRDPVFFNFLTTGSGSGMKKIRMNIPDHISDSLETIFGFKDT